MEGSKILTRREMRRQRKAFLLRRKEQNHATGILLPEDPQVEDPVEGFTVFGCVACGDLTPLEEDAAMCYSHLMCKECVRTAFVLTTAPNDASAFPAHCCRLISLFYTQHLLAPDVTQTPRSRRLNRGYSKYSYFCTQNLASRWRSMTTSVKCALSAGGLWLRMSGFQDRA